MSLESPTIFEKALTYKWAILIVAVVLIGASLFVWKMVSDWSFNRGVKKDKAAIANQLKEISNTEDQIANLQIKRAEQVVNVNRDTQEFLEASNASTAARTATNGTLANLANAVNANRSADVSAKDLEDKLKELNP